MARGAPGPPKHPGVKFPPPMLFVGGFVAAWLLDQLVPLRLAPGGARYEVEVGGTILLVVGLGVIAWGLVTLFRAKTAIMPHHPASRVVSHGPYRFTRNPMYLGMTLGYAGLALILNQAWPLLLLPLVLWSLLAFVIRREERYLGHAFGEEYLAYKGRVRRWI